MEQGYCIVLPEKQNAHKVQHVQDVDLLRYCQQAVKGHIEIVRPKYLPYPYVMLVNDTGRLRKTWRSILWPAICTAPRITDLRLSVLQ